MRAVVQKVTKASVSVNSSIISSIGLGIVVFIGIGAEDSIKDEDYILSKILGLRIFDDDNGIMNLSITDIGGEILLISQFTLYGDARQGRRPSYSSAMAPEAARKFYNIFFSKAKEQYPKIFTGEFGADMQVSLVNDGPVTILLDSTKIL